MQISDKDALTVARFKASFRRLGSVSATKGTGHIVFLVNISDSLHHLKMADRYRGRAMKMANGNDVDKDLQNVWDSRLKAAFAPSKYLLGNLKSIYGFPKPPLPRHTVPSGHWDLDTARNFPTEDQWDFSPLPHNVPVPHDKPRSKRGIVDWLMEGVAIGTATYAITEVNELKSRFLAEKDFIGKLAIALNETAMVTRDNARDIRLLRQNVLEADANLGMLENHIKWDFYFSRIEARLQAFTFSTLIQGEGVGHLTAHQLYPYLLDSNELKRSLVELNDKAGERGLAVAYNSITTAFEMPLMYQVVDDGFLAFLTVPLRSEDMMTLYELLPMPMILTDGRVVQLRTDKLLLGIDSGETKAFEFSKDFLQRKCLQHREDYTCSVPIMHRKPEDFCLGALFRENVNRPIFEVCNFSPRWEKTELLTEMSKGEVIFYTPRGVKVTMACLDNNTDDIISVPRGLRRFTVPDTCTLNTRDYSYTPEVNLEQTDDKLVHRLIDLSAADLGLPLMAWTSEENRTMELYKQLQEHVPVRLDKLNAALNDLDRQALKGAPTHLHVAAIAGIITAVVVVVILVVFSIMVYCFYKRKAAHFDKWAKDLHDLNDGKMEDLTHRTNNQEMLMAKAREDHRERSLHATIENRHAQTELKGLVANIKAAVKVMMSDDPDETNKQLRETLIEHVEQMTMGHEDDPNEAPYGANQWTLENE